MSMLLKEHLSFDQANVVVESVQDSATGGKNLYMSGIFIQGDRRNHNKRIYPLQEIRKAVSNISESIRQGFSILGELDHPSGANINLDRVSHLITEMWMGQGADGLGKLKILPTPVGNIAKTLIENGVKLGVSSRGEGDVDYSGNVKNFKIITVDIVAQPSAPEAFPVPLYEAFNHNRRGAEMEKLAKIINEDARAQDFLFKELRSFITGLK